MQRIIVIGVVAGAVIAAAIIVFLVLSQLQASSANNVADVRFVLFEADRQEIKVGETANVVMNVQNNEENAIIGARVVMVIEPSGQYLSLSNETITLPPLLGKDARTGEIKISIVATGSPAKEAVYGVKGVLIVNGVQTDTRQYDLKIHQE